jgi:hypothetical protein
MGSISLYTISWNGYWDKYGPTWISNINKFTTTPDQIVIVSDSDIDVSEIKNNNVLVVKVSDDKKYEKKHSFYRNTAVESCTSDWIVPSDLDDTPLPCFLDDIDDSVDVFSFSFRHNSTVYTSNSRVLLNKLEQVAPSKDNNYATIPSNSALKKSVFDKFRYEDNCIEDLVLYSMLAKQDYKVGYDNSRYRYIYSGYHYNYGEEPKRVSKIYQQIVAKKYRPLYVCWFSREMSHNRRAALKALYKNSNVDIEVISDKNFYSYNNQEIPIHPAFEYLSDVHKSAYARAYLMYFYGGGYSDIKENTFDWNPFFDQLFSSKYDAAGYPEKRATGIANFWGNDLELKNYVENNYQKFAGNGHYIFKPKTIFAKLWLEKVHELLSKKLPDLKKHPGSYHPYAVFGGVLSSHPESGRFNNSLYPITWNEINGRIMQKLQYESDCSNFLLTMPHPNVVNYR